MGKLNVSELVWMDVRKVPVWIGKRWGARFGAPGLEAGGDPPNPHFPLTQHLRWRWFGSEAVCVELVRGWGSARRLGWGCGVSGLLGPWVPFPSASTRRAGSRWTPGKGKGRRINSEGQESQL